MRVKHFKRLPIWREIGWYRGTFSFVPFGTELFLMKVLDGSHERAMLA